MRDVFVPRPFAGLTDEPEWVAMRELIPAATASLSLAPDLVAEHGERQIVLCTVLPMAWPAITRPEGRILVALQRDVRSGDISRDLAVTVLSALETPEGRPVRVPPLPGEGPRLNDVLAGDPLDVVVHQGFDYWLDGESADDPAVKESLDRANGNVFPTVRLAAAPAAYWCQVPGKAHVRWVLPDDEDHALAALSRLGAAGELLLGEGTKFAGMFRAHGLLVPVWDLPREPEAAQWEEPVAALASRYAEALAMSEPLSAAERRCRQGLLGRQLTLR